MLLQVFIRFVVGHLDPDSGRRQGLFQAGDALLASKRMSGEDAERLEVLYDWFKGHLPVPTRFSLSARPHAKAQALSWFRDTATEHIRHMRSYQRILEAYSVSVEMLRTERPGYIVYQDEHQIVAYPFADTPC